jgi:phosphate transport system substrate-binding protein
MKATARFSMPNIARYSSRISLCIQLLSLFVLGLHGAPGRAQNAVVLVGSGSTVPAPLYNRLAQEYSKRNPDIQMHYLPVGTGEGIKQISHGVGDFAAGEAQLSDKERKDGSLVELPLVLIGIVPIYNLPEINSELRLSGEVLAEIFLGDLKTWNAPQIARLNPDITLPSLPIKVINRPEGKGSNYVFTGFLSKTSSKFRTQVGTSASPKWPVGEPAERSSDMVDKVKSNPGSIGYVEYQYAAKSNVSQAAVLNPSGKFVKVSAESITAACQAAEAPRWNSLTASLSNSPGADSFPITSFSWIYLRTSPSDSARAVALADFLNWMYTGGQQYASQEGYSELPPALLAVVREKLKDLREAPVARKQP